MLVSHSTIWQIAMIDAATFVLAAFCYAALPVLPYSRASAGHHAGTVWEGWRVLQRHPSLRYAMTYLVMTVGLFQGFHTIARTALPMGMWGLAADGVTAVQMVTCLALVAAALCVSQWMCSARRSVRVAPAGLVCVTVFAMLVLLVTRQALPGFLAYFLFMFLFEVTYTTLTNHLVVTCPIDSLGPLHAVQQSLCMGAMLIVVFCAGLAMDHCGLPAVTLTMAVLAIGLAGIVALRERSAMSVAAAVPAEIPWHI